MIVAAVAGVGLLGVFAIASNGALITGAGDATGAGTVLAIGSTEVAAAVAGVLLAIVSNGALTTGAGLAATGNTVYLTAAAAAGAGGVEAAIVSKIPSF